MDGSYGLLFWPNSDFSDMLLDVSYTDACRNDRIWNRTILLSVGIRVKVGEPREAFDLPIAD
jgi:hypothetical protein